MSKPARRPDTSARPRAAPALVAAAFLALAAPDASGQGLVRVAGGAGRVGLAFDGTTFRTGGEATSARQTREWLELPFTGSLAGPRLFLYTLTLRPVFEQRSQPDFSEALGARQLDAMLAARLLPGRPVSVGLDLQRGSGVSEGGLGSRRAFTSSRSSATLWWQNRVFPAHLAVTRSSDDEQWLTAPGAAPLRALRDQRTLRLSANSSKTTLDIQRVAADDRVTGARLVAWEANALHALRWGHGSRLESSWQRAGERGTTSTARSVWAERAHLVHAPRLSGDYAVQRSDIRFADQRSRSTGWDAGLTARLDRHFSAGLALAGQTARVGETRQTAFSVAPRLGARTTLPGDVLLSASGSLSVERRHSRGPSNATVPVVDESYSVPPTRSVTLPRSGVEAGSLVVRSADGVIMFSEGLDYRVIVVGGVFRLVVPPESRIQVGDIVLVSYRYRALSGGGAGTSRLEYDVTLTRRGVEFRHRRAVRTGEAVGVAGIAGVAAPVIPGVDESRTEASVRTRTPLGAAGLDAGVRRWRRDRERTEEVQVSGSLAPPAFGRVTASVAVNAGSSRSGSTRVRALSATSSVTWMVAAALSARATAEAFRWEQSGLPAQRYLSAVVGADWRAGSMEAGLRVELHHRDYLVANVETRLVAQLTRRF